ncbi:solute carrier family 41 [Nematocida major]|uniref:solute carrier family 41 n=1 Tax=Nematocida major TaxID=1912982 RepID=UPI002007D92C|nr:solute carrier family 41 [Nematocida major]KAH9385562.1 solute carrier family 41 [Nematocida major]
MTIRIQAVRELMPSLLISLCGLFLMSTTLQKHLTGEYIRPMHYMFILNSMLCFKNNIELNYADMMSSTIKKARMHRNRVSTISLIEYIFDSGLQMFFVSMLFSLLIGVFANYKNIFELFLWDSAKKNTVLILSSVTAAFFSAACSCISTLVCVVFCIFISISFKFDTDNIILPIIASMADYVCTISLIYFSENIFIEASKKYPSVLSESFTPSSKFYHRIFITNCILVFFIVAILGMLYSHVRKNCTLRLFSPWSLFGSFSVTVLAGYLINTVTGDNPWLGCIIPLFNGVAGSIVLIYVGKVTTFATTKDALGSETGEIQIFDEEKFEDAPENPNSVGSICTLLVTSSLLSAVACVFMRFFFQKMPFFYIVLFGCLLNLQVTLMYFVTNTLVLIMQHFRVDISYHIVPLINAFSDLVGICVLGGSALLVL